MSFFDIKLLQKGSMVRRLLASGINLLMVATFLSAPTSIMLAAEGLAAPTPAVPAWMTKIIKDMQADNGALSNTDLDTLNKQFANSYTEAESIVARLNRLLYVAGLPYVITLPVRSGIKPGEKFDVRIDVYNTKTKQLVASQTVGSVVYDRNPAPVKGTPVQP